MAFNLAALSLKTKLIAGGAALVVAGGGVTGYVIYQSPDVVVGQAFGSLLSGENPSFLFDASLKSDYLSGEASLEIDTAKTGSLASMTASADYMNQNLGATLKVLSDKSGDAYVQLSDFDLLASFVVDLGYLPEDSVASVSSLLKENWIKVSKAEISNLAGTNTCFTDKLNDTSYTTKAGKEFGDLARANFFIVSTKELEQVGSDRVFDIWVDAEKLKGFLKAFKSTALYKDIQTCNPGFELSDLQINDINQEGIDNARDSVSVTLYADGMSHKMSELVLASKGTPSFDLKVSLKPNGDQSSKVKVPAKSISTTELMTALMGGY